MKILKSYKEKDSENIKIVDPHKKISREISAVELSVVMKTAMNMIKFCITPPKNFQIVLALTHSQVEKNDPLRFFVTNEKEIIINPMIINHTQYTVDSLEGCVTFPNNLNITVQRWNKCVVKYQTMDEDNKLTGIIEENISSQRAKMFQHELNHLDGKYIYNVNN